MIRKSLLLIGILLSARVSIAGENSIIEELMQKKVIIWDNDSTITDRDPQDPTGKTKIILPNIKEVMGKCSATIHIICSGCQTPDTAFQHHDIGKGIDKFKNIMAQLPTVAAVFAPPIHGSMGGTDCYVVLKRNNKISTYALHEEERYKQYIGAFKKPAIGMFVVIRDLLQEVFGIIMDAKNTIKIDDSWHDKNTGCGNEYSIFRCGSIFIK